MSDAQTSLKIRNIKKASVFGGGRGFGWIVILVQTWTVLRPECLPHMAQRAPTLCEAQENVLIQIHIGMVTVCGTGWSLECQLTGAIYVVLKGGHNVFVK